MDRIKMLFIDKKSKFFFSIMLLFLFLLFAFISSSAVKSEIVVDKGNLFISNVPEQSTSGGLKDAIEKLGFVGNVYSLTGELLNESDIVHTGHYFKSGIKTYTIIISGDINPDGVIDSTDYLYLKKYLLSNFDFSDIQKVAADINGDDIINALDYLKIKAHFLGIAKISEPLVTPDISEEVSYTSSEESIEISDEESSQELSSVEVESSQDISNEEQSSYEDIYYTVNYNVQDDKMGYITGESSQVVIEGTSGTTICAQPNMYYKFVAWSDGVTTAERSDVLYGDREYTAYFEYVGFPVMRLDYNGTIMRDEYTSGAITIENCPSEYSLASYSVNIKGRGNSSWSFEKKSYKIKLSNKQNLFGIGDKARKDWVLVSNHCDKTLMRNYFGYTLADKLDGIDVAYGVMQVHLYLNDVYVGVYMLTEEVEVNKGRVDIDTEGTDNNIGFLLELDQYYSGTENVDYVRVNNLYFSIKSDFLTSQQVQYMKNFLTHCDAAIRNGSEELVSQYCDVDSLIDMYIIQEFTKNIDVGWSSFYIYYNKGETIIHFGPVWDLDLAMGNDFRLDNGSYQNIYVGKEYGVDQCNDWFIALAKRTWFRTAVNKRWDEVKGIILEHINQTEKFMNVHQNEFIKNFSKWRIYNKRINVEPDHLLKFSSYLQNADHLIEWLNGRYNWLDSYFNSWINRKP